MALLYEQMKSPVGTLESSGRRGRKSPWRSRPCHFSHPIARLTSVELTPDFLSIANLFHGSDAYHVFAIAKT